LHNGAAHVAFGSVHGLGRCGVVSFAAQYLTQHNCCVRFSAVVTFCLQHFSFREGAEDAAYLAKKFEPVFAAEDFLRLPNYRAYLRLLIDGSAPWPVALPVHDVSNRQTLVATG
jgi:hypothetical protein